MRFKAQLKKLLLVNEGKLNLRALASNIAESKEIPLSEGTIYNYLLKLKREEKEVISIDNTPSWEVVQDNYIFEIKGSTKVFSVALIDSIFLYYTSKGYNFTRSKVQQRFNLTPKSFHTIQNVFNLSKDSDVFSPYTKATTSKEDLDKLADSLMEEIINSGEMTSKKYDETLRRKYKQIVDKNNLSKVWENEVLSDLLDRLPSATNISLPVSKASDIEELLVGIADLHAGAKFNNNLISADFSYDILVNKLQNVSALTNRKRAKDVHLFIAGDLVESLSAVMHPDQFKGMEQDGYGADVIFKTYEMIVDNLVNEIFNLKSIIFVAGNHDRSNPSNKLMDSMAVDILVYMLRERLKGKVKVEYNPHIIGCDFKGFGVVGCHGHKGLHKRESSFLVENFAVDRNKFQFILNAHYHAFICKNNDDSFNHIKVTIPSIVTGNLYSDLDIGRSARPGVFFGWMNEFNEPSMLIERI